MFGLKYTLPGPFVSVCWVEILKLDLLFMLICADNWQVTQLNGSKKNSSFYIIEMKVLKKAKIVNISLNNQKHNSPNTIHFSQDYSQDQIASSSLKQQQLVDDCYEAIRIIALEKGKTHGGDKKTMMKTTPDGFLQFKKTEKENEIKMPFSIAESVELILKRFVQVKANEDQKGFRNSSSKLKQINPNKTSNKALYFRKHKQNTEQSVEDKIEEDYCAKVFKMMAPNSVGHHKLQNKMQQLQRQIQYYKDKMAEQSALIAKLETRDMLMRKKYHDQVAKIIRTKNILNIQASFQKEMEGRYEGRGLLGVNGRSMATAGQNRKKEDHSSKRSSQSIEQISFKDTLTAKKNELMQQSDGFKPYASSSNVFGNYLIHNLQTLKEVAKDLSEDVQNEDERPQTEHLTEKSKRIQELRFEEATLRQERKRTIRQMSGVTNDELERNLQEIQEKLLEKMNEIYKEQMLQEKELSLQVDVLGIKNQDFQAMQMNGFYQQSQQQPTIKIHPES